MPRRNREEDIEKTKYRGKIMGIALQKTRDGYKVQVYIPSLHGKYDSSKRNRNKVPGSGDKEYPWANISIENLTYRNAGRETTDHTDSNVTTGYIKQKPDTLSSYWLYCGEGGKFDIVWLSFQDGDMNFPVYEDCVGYLTNSDLFKLDSKTTTQYVKKASTAITLQVGGWTVPGSSQILTSSSNKYRDGKTLDTIVNDIVYGNKDYAYLDNVTNPHNSYITNVSLSKLELEGNDARDFIKLIQSSDPNVISDAETTYDISLNLDKDWTYVTVDEGSALEQALEYILESDESKRLQDSIICTKMNEYINTIYNSGLEDPRAYIYFCDVADTNYDEAISIMHETKDMIYSSRAEDELSTMNNITIGGGYLSGSYIDGNNDKRRETYNKILELESNGGFIPQHDIQFHAKPFELLYPVSYRYKITTDFGYYIRERTMENYEYIYHNSVDITGDDIFEKSVLAGFDSTVTVGENEDYGNYVELSNEHYVARYSHLSGICVSTGNTIRMGTVIGYVGYSGDTSGICLNLSLFDIDKGAYIDPKPYFIANTIGDKYGNY